MAKAITDERARLALNAQLEACADARDWEGYAAAVAHGTCDAFRLVQAPSRAVAYDRTVQGGGAAFMQQQARWYDLPEHAALFLAATTDDNVIMHAAVRRLFRDCTSTVACDQARDAYAAGIRLDPQYVTREFDDGHNPLVKSAWAQRYDLVSMLCTFDGHDVVYIARALSRMNIETAEARAATEALIAYAVDRGIMAVQQRQVMSIGYNAGAGVLMMVVRALPAWTAELAESVAELGFDDVLHALRTARDAPCPMDTRAVRAAASAGKLSTVRALCEERPRIVPNSAAITAAAARGSANIVKYLQTEAPRPATPSRRTLCYAVSYVANSVAILRLLREGDAPPCRQGPGALARAVEVAIIQGNADPFWYLVRGQPDPIPVTGAALRTALSLCSGRRVPPARAIIQWMLELPYARVLVTARTISCAALAPPDVGFERLFAIYPKLAWYRAVLDQRLSRAVVQPFHHRGDYARLLVEPNLRVSARWLGKLLAPPGTADTDAWVAAYINAANVDG
jgi:hypothetical protein